VVDHDLFVKLYFHIFAGRRLLQATVSLTELGLPGYDTGGILVFQHHKHGMGCV
jgi:hypothetical protein